MFEIVATNLLSFDVILLYAQHPKKLDMQKEAL